MKEKNLKPSSFYWGIYMILSCIFLVGYIISDKLWLLFVGLLFYGLALFINHNKKYKKKINTQE